MVAVARSREKSFLGTRRFVERNYTRRHKVASFEIFIDPIQFSDSQGFWYGSPRPPAFQLLTPI
jgi:hypothetical protein